MEKPNQIQKKLKLVNLDLCPYLIPADSWKNDLTKWPALEYSDIYHYLVETPGIFTRESMKSRKSLEAHNQFCYFESRGYAISATERRTTCTMDGSILTEHKD